jgi:hypothetical protein
MYAADRNATTILMERATKRQGDSAITGAVPLEVKSTI